MSGEQGHPTLAQVAAAAGVSLSTASRALRPDGSVQESTRRRVRAAARRLGYEPNRLARSLRTRASSFAGVIVPDIGVLGFDARAVKGAQDALERAGYEGDPDEHRAAGVAGAIRTVERRAEDLRIASERVSPGSTMCWPRSCSACTWTWIITALSIVGYGAMFLISSEELRSAASMHPEDPARQ